MKRSQMALLILAAFAVAADAVSVDDLVGDEVEVDSFSAHSAFSCLADDSSASSSVLDSSLGSSLDPSDCLFDS